MPWFRLVDSTRTNVCPVEFVLQIDVAKSDRSLHYGTLVGSHTAHHCSDIATRPSRIAIQASEMFHARISESCRPAWCA
jgi:hypothetical protein